MENFVNQCEDSTDCYGANERITCVCSCTLVVLTWLSLNTASAKTQEFHENRLKHYGIEDTSDEMFSAPPVNTFKRHMTMQGCHISHFWIIHPILCWGHVGTEDAVFLHYLCLRKSVIGLCQGHQNNPLTSEMMTFGLNCRDGTFSSLVLSTQYPFQSKGVFFFTQRCFWSCAV